MTPRPSATISVDLDPVDVHLRGYGHARLPPDPRVHEIALPRLLDLFARCQVPATFFVLARDVPSERPAIGAITAMGHEIASHGIDHLPSFANQPTGTIRSEVIESRSRLEEAGGQPVVGFRAPDWSVGPRLVAALAAAGYRYDASLMPTPALPVGRLFLALRARRLGDMAAVRPPASLRRQPFSWKTDLGAICEFPVAVSPRLRFPLYHTSRPVIGDVAFERHLDGFVARSESLSYALHGVDALGLREDRVDPRLEGHPGMSHSLDAKLALLERTVRSIADRFAVRTFADRVDDEPGAPGSRGAESC